MIPSKSRYFKRMSHSTISCHPFSKYAKLTYTYMCVSGGTKCKFLGKFCVHTTWMTPYDIFFLPETFLNISIQSDDRRVQIAGYNLIN